jgi:hypothetical protein
VSKTPIWRKALPAPGTGRANIRIYAKYGEGEAVVEVVRDLRDVPARYVKEIFDQISKLGKVGRTGENVVHILRAGVTFCRMDGVQAEWPAGHTWVGVEEKHLATCPECLEVSNLVDKGT